MRLLNSEEIINVSGSKKEMLRVSDGIIQIELGPLDLTAMGAGTLYGLYLSNTVTSPWIGMFLPLSGCILGAVVARTATYFMSTD